MNVRDPFNLHRTSNSAAFQILRATDTSAAAGISAKAVEAGTNALEAGRQAVSDAAETMSFSVPKNVPSFANPQRVLEDKLWPSSGVSSRRGVGSSTGGGLGARVGGLLHPDRDSLPMYKDKPYGYPGSQRARPLYRRKRVLGFLTLLVLVFMWYFGFLTEHQEKVRGKVSGWGWLQSDQGKAKSKADWMKRRERVVEAFELSWDAYSRYAWGE
jgi:mannosyl-oligosaccharide alpha-1,2-mannosidase